MVNLNQAESSCWVRNWLSEPSSRVGAAISVSGMVRAVAQLRFDARTARQAENSEVLLPLSVAVAVINAVVGTVMGSVALMRAFPLPFVVTVVKPRYVAPSPYPEASQAVFEKNSMRKFVLAVLFNVPRISVSDVRASTCCSAGKFCRLLGPLSASPTSLAVIPSPVGSVAVGLRSMPSAPFWLMALPRMRLPVAVA